MRTQALRQRLCEAAELTPAERQRAIVVVQPPSCPSCHHHPCGHRGHTQGLPRYRCAACGKTFDALTGTPAARLRHREHGQEYAQPLIDGDTVRRAAHRCGVPKNTDFRWRHRFLTRLADLKPVHLYGLDEVDETCFLESHKGERQLPRPPRKRGGSARQRGLSDK